MGARKRQPGGGARAKTKACPECRATRPLEDFTRNRTNADGRERLCRDCKGERLRRYRAKNAGRVVTPAEDADDARTLRLLNDTADIGVLRAMLREEITKRRRLESVHTVVVDAARDILEPLRIPATVRPFRPRKQYSRTAESQVLHLSDLQVGKVTSTYNMERFATEMRDLFETTVELAEIFRSHHPVEELVIAANGDLVEGEEIFPGQAWVSQVGAFKQAVRGSEILAAEIARVAPHYPCIRIKVTRGNHGRGGKTWCEKSNWDLVLGELLRHQLSRVSNVTVDVCEDWYTTTKVQGRVVMQTHGDRIRSGGDFPFTAILKRGNLWRTSIPEGWDVLLVGHFHHYAECSINGAVVFVNGSPESANDYAQSYMGQCSIPLQGMFFVHPRVGVTYRTPVYLGRGLQGVRAAA